jgi:hypothetical protein
MVVGMLTLALGQPGAQSPITGTLDYALKELQKR